jgi:hypothetical protein
MSGGKQVLLAEPRSLRAGARRAIAIIDLALEQHGAPVCVRKEIVRRRTLPLVGHADHEEVEGTYGHAPDQTVIVETVADAEALDLPLDAPRKWNGEELLHFDGVDCTKIAEQPSGRAGLPRPRQAERYHATSLIIAGNGF